MRNLFDLTGKVALVVGATGEIGAAIAVTLGEHGADVVIAGRRQAKLKVVADRIRSLQRQTLTVTVEVTDQQSVESMVEQGLSMFSRIDILVNAAGLAIRKPADFVSH